MRAVIQRVSAASVSVGGEVRGAIAAGMLILLGIEPRDGDADVQWLSRKIAHLRIFADKAGKMNKGVKDISGNILVVSQFTLFASTKKGMRPAFIGAADPAHAIPLYEQFVERLSAEIGQPVQTGEFGAEMQVSLQNDGPVTLLIDTKRRE